jgi:hypothetical protein
MRAKYRRPWAIMENSVDVAPNGARIVRRCGDHSPDKIAVYIDEDDRIWKATELTEMDTAAAEMRSALTKHDRL